MAWITCSRCLHLQKFTGQFACEKCKVRLNNWSVVAQLKAQNLNLDNYKSEYDHEEADSMEEK